VARAKHWENPIRHAFRGVLTQAADAAAALTANTTAMNRVFAALKAAGIPDNKIQTSNFSVQPQYPPYRAGCALRQQDDHRLPGLQPGERRRG
jgi:hypothetical protein